uniref:CKLF like MARVEL transmembrane domain containing 6 n=1 Tax=Sphenodon punctatus TaxID=8508 RepID=A0A8D0L1V4_SPHPU
MENGAPVYAPTTETAEQPRKSPACTCTVARLTRPCLLLKAAQVVSSFLAFVFEEIVNQCTSCGGLYFFEFISCTAFLTSVLILVVYCTSAYEKIGKQKFKQSEFWALAAVGVFFLLASIVFAATNDKTSVETVAVVFGFLASILFLVDFGQRVKEKCKTGKAGKPENTDNTQNTTENQPLNNQQPV